jgi:Ca2+-binding RTX toxin-like protein
MAVVQPKLWNSISVASSGAADLDAITMLPNGGYVVAFRQDQRIAFQIYDGKGDKVGGIHLVAEPVAGAQWEPDILTYKADGTFVITWTEASGGTGGGRVLRSQAFDMAGTPSTVTTVNNSTQEDGAHLSTDGNGGWATAYVEGVNVGQTITPTVRFMLTDSEGNAGNPISISNANGVGRPDVAWIGGTSYVVSYLTTGVNSGFEFSVVSGGVVASASFPNAVETDVTALKNPETGAPTGQFVVLYRTDAGAIVSKTCQLAANNTIQEVRTFTLFPATPNLSSADYKTSVTALRDGGYAVAYMAPGSDLNNIWIRVFDKDGNTTEQPFEIAIPLNLQKTPAIHEMADGRLAVSWQNPSEGVGRVDTVTVDARAEAVHVSGTAADDIYAPSVHAGDNFDGGAGFDTLTFQAATSGVAVDLVAGQGSAGMAAGDVYTSFEKVIGSNFADTLTGGAGHVLQGGAGDDVYFVKAGTTLVEGAGGGTDSVFADETYTLSDHLENLFATGANAINLIGNGGNNLIVGNEAANQLVGAGGNDTLRGGGGSDALDGGAGDDSLEGGDGSDNLSGGDGNDVMNGGTGADVMNGGAGNDVYYIDDVNDQVIDGSGIDTVFISASYDLARLGAIENITGLGAASITLTGTAANNVLTGNDGANILYGGAGNDVLNGGAGNDRIHGQEGNDVLIGGAGRDIFVFDKRPHKSTNVDKIMDFNVRDDSIYLENKYFKVGSKGSLTKPAQMASKHFYKGVKAHDADDRMIYDSKKGILYYDADGTGGAAQIKIATLDKKPALTIKDFFVI